MPILSSASDQTAGRPDGVSQQADELLCTRLVGFASMFGTDNMDEDALAKILVEQRSLLVRLALEAVGHEKGAHC